MLTDETKVVTREFSYTTYDNRVITTIDVYGYEREGYSIEDILASAVKYYGNDCQIMTIAEYEKRERELVLDMGVYEVDEETFNEMLNVLPPLKWCDRVCEKHRANVNEFCMSEFTKGPYTQQYARAYINGKTRYYGATVNFYDESTWIHNNL